MTDIEKKPDRSAARLVLLGGVALILLGSVWTGTRIFGTLDAGMEVKRTPFGPVQIGIDGRMGEADAKLPPATGQGSAQLAYAAPYYGPTPEETRVLAEMQAVTNRVWAKERERWPVGGQAEKPPLLELPQRALTAYELDQMRETIKRLKVLAE